MLAFFLGIYCYGYCQIKNNFVIYNQSEIVLQNARVVDVAKGIVLEGYSLLISNGKISSMGKTGKFPVFKTAHVIDF